ncbi:MAG: hypothetical protein JO252_14775 [Planctomycetaceae bacterium]|nr:hypothetical protein [Planctomycetaceae bacterium]
MTPQVLVGQHVKVALWDDLADLMPGGSVGLITQVKGDGDDVELTVQLRGFRRTFIFSPREVELLPSDYIEAALFTATPPARQEDKILLHPSIEAARLEVGSRRPIYQVAACLARDGHRLLPHGSLSPDFDPAWTTSAESHGDGSVTAQGPIPSWLFVG